MSLTYRIEKNHCTIKGITISKPKTGIKLINSDNGEADINREINFLWFKKFDFKFLPVLDETFLSKYPILDSLLYDARETDSSKLDLTEREYLEFAKITKLEIVHFGDDLTEVPVNLFKHAQVLRELYMNDNQITKVPEDFFINNPKLEAVSFNFNKLTIIPEKLFANNPKMTHIFMHHNQIISLPPNLIAGNPLLVVFHAKGNKFESVPENFKKNNPKLTEFVIE